MPTYQHPFAKALAPYEDRVKMCELAMGWLPRVEISRVEEELGGESRTLRTIEHLRAQHPDWQLRFIMGADLVVESSKWYGFDRIVELAPPIVLGRVGRRRTRARRLPFFLPSRAPRCAPMIGDRSAGSELEPLVPRAVLGPCRAREALRDEVMKVFILGAGKVGRALATALRDAW